MDELDDAGGTNGTDGALPLCDQAWLRGLDLAARSLAPLGANVHGPATVVKQWSISRLVRLPTDVGDFYAKAVPALFVREPTVIRSLAERHPGSVPDVVAWRDEPGGGVAFVMRAFAGSALSPAHAAAPQVADDAGPWTTTVRLLATMQVEALTHLSELDASGAAGRPITGLPAQFSALLGDGLPAAPGIEDRLDADEMDRLRSLEPGIAAAVEVLRASPVPAGTLVHGDFHGGNVFMVPGAAGTARRPLFFDWTDAAIAHPFFDLPLMLESRGAPEAGARSAVLAAYLDTWAEAGFGEMADLRRTYDLAAAVAPLYHALSYAGILAATGSDGWAQMGHAIPRFCRRLLQESGRLPRGQTPRHPRGATRSAGTRPRPR